MRRCVITAGAEIQNYERARCALRPDDYFIFCDSGLNHMEKLGVKPDLIVGDFDSHENPHLAAETLVLPCEKDDTDTMFAVKEALRRGFQDFLLLGAVGQRLDHSLGNISALLLLDRLGLCGKILDDYSEMEIVSRAPAYVDGSFAYFSLLNVSGLAEGVTVRKAKYPLSEAVISYEDPYGISNQPLPGERAEISVARGRLLLIKVYEA